MARTQTGWLALTIVAVTAVWTAPALAQGSADAQASALVNQASASANNIFSTVGEMLKGTRQSELMVEGSGKLPEDLQQQFNRIDPEVVDKLLQAGGMSCAAVGEAQKVLYFLAGHYAALGIPPRPSVTNAISQLDPTRGKCEEDAKAACKAKSDPNILIAFWTKTTRTAAVTGTEIGLAGPSMEKRARRICAPKSYTVSGNAGPMTATGTVCSLDKPFTVKAAGGGMQVQFSYTPTSDDGGRVTYSGGGAGAPMSGAGTYTVTETDKGGTIKQTHSGKVNIPMGGSATHTDTFTLTVRGPPC